MPLSNPDDTLLLIRCPSCGQRFKVGDDLRGRTVECGGCEHRFRINDDVIVRGKKFYPGERKDSSLNRFQRVPLAVASTSSAIPVARYMEAPSPLTFEPISPQRIVAGIVGVAGMICMALLLMFGSHRGGILDGMATQDRLLMAGFTGLLGIVMLVYANPRSRFRAIFFGLLMSAGLLSLPFFFTVGSVPLSALELASQPPAEEIKTLEPVSGESKTISDLRELIGTRPLEDEVARLASEGSSKRVIGIWLRNLREHNRLVVRDYIHRATESDSPPHYFPRENGNFLMIVSGTKASLDEVARMAVSIGTLENIYPQISVVEVRVNNESFVEGPIEKLNDRKDPDFYSLNKRELDSIDLDRVTKAVKRLAEAEPKVYRTDISRKLIQLLGAQWVDFKGDVCKALIVWSEKPGEAGKAALKEVMDMRSRKRPIPQEMVALIVKEQITEAIPMIDELWSENPTQWEPLYSKVGPQAEAKLIGRLSTAEGALRQSVVRLLGNLGGEASLPLLEAALVGADAELRVLIEKSTASIRKRLGQ